RPGIHVHSEVLPVSGPDPSLPPPVSVLCPFRRSGGGAGAGLPDSHDQPDVSRPDGDGRGPAGGSSGGGSAARAVAGISHRGPSPGSPGRGQPPVAGAVFLVYGILPVAGTVQEVG